MERYEYILIACTVMLLVFLAMGAIECARYTIESRRREIRYQELGELMRECAEGVQALGEGFSPVACDRFAEAYFGERVR